MVSTAYSQALNFQRDVTPFPVRDAAGSDLQFPFLGGLNSPRPQFVDIDGDGDSDLFVQEEDATFNRPGNLMFFENVGSPTGFNYQWRTDSFLNLDVGNWYQFVDIDGDSDFDLFAERQPALIRIYRNVGSASSPEFVLAADSLRDLDGTLIQFDLGSLPEVADIDCDGNLDLLVGRAAAGTISLFRGVGLNGQNVPLFEEIPGNFQDISIIGEIGPVARHSDIFDGNSSAETGHGSNSLTVVDIENDGDPDLFWGDIFEDSMVFLQNAGTCAAPDIDITTRDFPPQQPLLTSGFNAPRFTDIDGDNDRDLFVGVLGGGFSTVSHLIRNFYFFRNTGSASQPQFTEITGQFLPNLDVGSFSIPALADIDGDGDLDLFVGNEAATDESGTARLAFYRNTGTQTSPAFQLEDDHFLGLNLSINYAPTFVDLDSDGDLDLLLGDWSGRVFFIRNDGTRQQFVAAAPQPLSAEIEGENLVLDIGNNAVPAICDIDSDGDLDLFVGEFQGNLNFFENIGSAAVENYILRETNYAGISAGGYSTPVFTDIDEDGDLDLFLGSESNGVRFYRNSGTANTASFTAEETVLTGFKNNFAPAFADVDGEGDLDAFYGNRKGGLLFYENLRIATSIDEPENSLLPTRFVLYPNYPNPFNPQTNIAYDLPERTFVQLVIYDVLGRAVHTLVAADQTAGIHRVTWDGADQSGRQVATGIYFCRLRAGEFVATGRMLLLR